jgi:ATP-dependent DNA helicase HFM1/MER3
MQAASAPGPEQAECKSATDNTIFDHIRKKSKEFPTLMVSKSMDSSYEPLILKKMKISRDQFEVEHGCLHADEATTLDFEPVEPRVSLTNTAEKCRGILGRSSEKSRMLFGIMDSPSEKSTMLSTTPDKSSLRNAGGKESPLEKSKVLSTSAENSLQFAVRGVNSSEKSKMLTTPDKSSLVSAGGKESPLEKSEVVSTSAENSLQFAARHVNSSENSKMLTTPDKSSLVFAGGKDSPLEKSKILISTPVEYPLKKGNPGENPFKTGTPVENSPQFAAQCDSPSKKRKSCISSPLPCLQAVQCTEQVRAAGQPFDIQEYVKEISRSRKNSQGGDPFAGYKSIFSFLY